MASTGNGIETRRRALGLTRGQLAKRIGVTYLQVYRVETGKTRLHFEDVPAWAKALKLKPEALAAELVA
jgi:transcriptional regulator with XRE-family HTH domain